MKQYRLIVLTMMVCLAIPAFAANQRYAIRSESIAAAMRGMGMQVAPEQVVLLTDVEATSNTPRLRVRSMQKSGDNRLMVRLECESSDECVPFFARIRFGTDNQSQASGPEPSSIQMTAAGHSKPVEIRVGSTATLMLDGDHVHIRIAVVCLENGAAGQKIRVAAGDRRQVYLAEVIDGKLLKGSL